MNEIQFSTECKPTLEQLLDLYNSVDWFAYTNTENAPKLLTAFQNSTYSVTVWYGSKLIGLARGMSDDVSIFYLQDILIRPEFQGQGIGKQLLTNCLERFTHVRMKVLLTDDREQQLKFYEAMGFTNTKDIQDFEINTFVKISGLTP